MWPKHSCFGPRPFARSLPLQRRPRPKQECFGHIEVLMKKTILTLLLLLLALPLAAAQKVDTAAIDGIMTKALASWHVPGASIAVVKDGQVVYLKGYGVRDIGT